MITYDLKDVVDYVEKNKDIYDIFYEKNLNLFGVLIYIYHKENIENYEKENMHLYFIHKYLNGLVIHSTPSDEYELVICPDDTNNNFIYARKFDDIIVTNYKTKDYDDRIKKIVNNFNYNNFKFEISNDEIILIKGY